MVQNQAFQVQSEAEEALARWNAFFADQVVLQAKALSKESVPSGYITLDHYRQAAMIAVEALATEVHNTGSSDNRQEVWNSELNSRRFELIDGEIQGTLSIAEQFELETLTNLMRKHVDAEENFPFEGARILHKHLTELKLDSTDEKQ